MALAVEEEDGDDDWEEGPAVAVAVVSIMRTPPEGGEEGRGLAYLQLNSEEAAQLTNNNKNPLSNANTHTNCLPAHPPVATAVSSKDNTQTHSALTQPVQRCAVLPFRPMANSSSPSKVSSLLLWKFLQVLQNFTHTHTHEIPRPAYAATFLANPPSEHGSARNSLAANPLRNCDSAEPNHKKVTPDDDSGWPETVVTSPEREPRWTTTTTNERTNKTRNLDDPRRKK